MTMIAHVILFVALYGATTTCGHVVIGQMIPRAWQGRAKNMSVERFVDDASSVFVRPDDDQFPSQEDMNSQIVGDTHCSHTTLPSTPCFRKTSLASCRKITSTKKPKGCNNTPRRCWNIKRTKQPSCCVYKTSTTTKCRPTVKSCLTTRCRSTICTRQVV